MRIVYFADARSMHTQRWAEFFSTRGHDVHVVSTDPPTETYSSVNHHLLEFDGRKNTHGLEYFWKLRQAARAITNEISPDIVHAHYVAGYGHIGWLSGRRPLVLTAWGSDIYQLHKYSLTGQVLTRLALRNADLVTCDSHDLMRAAVRTGALKNKVRLIQFGVDTRLFVPNCNTNAIKEQLNIQGTGPIVLSSRAIQPIYNIDVIVRSFARIVSEFPNALLLIKYSSADSDYFQDIAELIDSLQITSRVRLVGTLPYESMAQLYAISDVVISLAQTDGTPMTALESMACGTPVVASNLPSLREWITDGENGFLAEPRDVEQVAIKLQKALTLPEDIRIQWAEKNRQMVLERADQHKNMLQMEELYKALLC